MWRLRLWAPSPYSCLTLPWTRPILSSFIPPSPIAFFSRSASLKRPPQQPHPSHVGPKKFSRTRWESPKELQESTDGFDEGYEEDSNDTSHSKSLVVSTPKSLSRRTHYSPPAPYTKARPPVPWLSRHEIWQLDKKEELQEVLDIHIPTSLKSLITLAENVASVSHVGDSISVSDVYGTKGIQRTLKQRRLTVKDSFGLLFSQSFIQWEYLYKNRLISPSSAVSDSSSHVEVVWNAMCRYTRPSGHYIAKLITYFGKEKKTKKLKEIYESIMDLAEGSASDDSVWKKQRDKLKQREEQLAALNESPVAALASLSVLPLHPLTYQDFDTVCFNSLLSSLNEAKAFDLARKLFTDAKTGKLFGSGSKIKRFQLDRISYGTAMKMMINVVSQSESLQSSLHSSKSPKDPLLASPAESMLELFHDMKSVGIWPNHYIYSHLISFYGIHLSHFTLAESIWKYIEEHENPLNFRINQPMMNTMVGVLARQGRIDDIIALVKRIKYKYSVKKIPIRRGNQLQYKSLGTKYLVEVNQRTVHSILTSLCKSQLYEKAIKFHSSLENGLLGGHIKPNRESYVTLLQLLCNRRQEDGEKDIKKEDKVKDRKSVKVNGSSNSPSRITLSTILNLYSDGLKSGELLQSTKESEVLGGKKKFIIDLRRYDLSLIPLILRHELNEMFDLYVKQMESGGRLKRGKETIPPRRGLIVLLGKSPRDKIQQWDFMQAVKAADATGEPIDDVLRMQAAMRMIKSGRTEEGQNKVGDLADSDDLDPNDPWTNEIQDDFDEDRFDEHGNLLPEKKEKPKKLDSTTVSFSEDPNNPDFVLPGPKEASFRARFVLFWLQQLTPRIRGKLKKQYYSLKTANGTHEMGNKEGEEDEDDFDESEVKGNEDDIEEGEDDDYVMDAEFEEIEGDDSNGNTTNAITRHNAKGLRKSKSRTALSASRTSSLSSRLPDAVSSSSMEGSLPPHIPASTVSLDSSIIVIPHPALLWWLECQYAVHKGHNRPQKIRANQLKWWSRAIHAIREEKEKESSDNYYIIDELDRFKSFLREKKEWNHERDETELYAIQQTHTQSKKVNPSTSQALPSSSSDALRTSLESRHLKSRLESILQMTPPKAMIEARREEEARRNTMLREEELIAAEKEEKKRKQREAEKEKGKAEKRTPIDASNTKRRRDSNEERKGSNVNNRSPSAPQTRGRSSFFSETTMEEIQNAIPNARRN